MCVLALHSACTVVETRQKPIDTKKAAEANVKLGAAYIQEGLLNVANEKLERALQLDPKNPQAHNMYGVLNHKLGLADKAREHFKKALALDPDNPDIKNNYGSFLCRQGQVSQAEEMFKAALSDPLYSTPEFAWANAGACVLNVPDFVKADDYLRRALHHDPTLPMALCQSAKLHYLKGSYAVSRHYLERCFSVSNQNPESLWLAVRLAWKTGDNQAAKKYSSMLKCKFPYSEETRKLDQTVRYAKPSCQ